MFAVSRILAFIACLVTLESATVAEKTPWRVGSALELPTWLTLEAESRIRIAHLTDQFRSGSDGNPTALSFRTRLSARISTNAFRAGLELLDSRVYANSDTPLNTTHGNPVDVLQAYMGVQTNNFISYGDELNLRAGRLTMDVGSRRLVARNRYRNTINSFTGVDVEWTSPKKHTARFFAVVPVRRRPDDPAAIESNQFKFDKENINAFLAGLFYSVPDFLEEGFDVEAFLVSLTETDGDQPSRNRRIYTPGFRLMKKPKAGHVDGQLEAMLQVGTSRASALDNDTDDLDHLAYFAHAEVGYTFSAPWQPRLAFQYDFASGDRNPNDGKSNRFDTLFGARRFDFGPTGIYGAFARTNINTPGLRVRLAPTSAIDGFVAHRLFWLAAKRDTWTTSGLQDPTGESGRFIGQQIEGRARFQIVPGNVRLETGAAYFIPGSFAKNAATSPTETALLFYTQLVLTI